MTTEAIHPLQALAGGTYYPVSGDVIATSDAAALKCRAAAAIRDTPALLTEARGWILDAYSLDPEGLDTLTPARVLVTLQRGYAGGCLEFYLNSLQLTPTLTRKA
jgi:hypothetical protein